MRRLPINEQARQRNREVTRINPPSSLGAANQHVSGSLLIVTLIMVSFGLVMLFSASMSIGYASTGGNSMYYVLRQSGITAMGLVAALFLALFVRVHFFDRMFFTLIAYLVVSGLLVYVRLFGIVIQNARRWVRIGILFQPSELAKIAIVFCFAGYTSWVRRMRRKGHFRRKTMLGQFLADGWVDVLLPGLMMLVWIVLVLIQPHLSGGLILGFVGLTVMLVAGLPLRSWMSAMTQVLLFLLVVVLLVSLLLPLLPVDELRADLEENFRHVGRRLDIFFNPETVDASDSYQIDQSILAIGSGGLTGLGLGEGRQKYNYLPEAHNDFVFAIISEELGFIGSLTVILLFMLFMLIGISITLRAGSVFAAILAGGYTMLITVQALLNIGVATRSIPPTGISLPFFSYGGTSNLFFLISIGLILAVSRTGLRGRSQPALPDNHRVTAIDEPQRPRQNERS